ncbi:MAG TPA: hypothetical protein VLI04_03250 [Nocardioidaceae bacterium]|nr:hypothetical protein [Nocardioidaceae bacterium]
MIAVLQAVAIWAATTHAALGLAAGIAEVLVAWLSRPAHGARVLRLLLFSFGAVTIALSLYWWAF